MAIFDSFLFLFSMFHSFGHLSLFSVSILGTGHYAYHLLMMVKIDYCMLLELNIQVWKKSGSGPKNGEQYVTSFVEEK